LGRNRTFAGKKLKKMKKIGLLSDTHGYWDEKYEVYFAPCDEVWHAGDIGSLALANRFEAMKPFRAVYGNIDDHGTRAVYPQTLRFTLEKVDVLMTHIGGYPGRYDPSIRPQLYSRPPKLFIAGHSHILKVMYDKKLDCLHMNPGAAGKYGFHRVRTLLRFVLDDGNIKDLEVIEIGKQG
jgi:Predicted phosphoesterase